MCSEEQENNEQALSVIRILFGLAIVVAYVLGMQMWTSDLFRGDEMWHYPQIAAFIEGRFDIVNPGILTMLPGYHAIVAAMAWGVSDPSPSTVRILSAILCFPTIVLFFLCARALGKSNRFSLSLLFLLCPILFPFFFVIYTDIPSLLFLLGALFLTLKRRYQLAGLVVVLALLVRQTNIVWAFLMALIALDQEGMWGGGHTWKPALRTVAQLWLFVFAGFAFLAFVYWNGGVALGKSQVGHDARGYLFPTQGYLWLFTMFFLFVPLHIWNVPRIVDMIRHRPTLWVLSSACVFVFYIQTFWVDHEWNFMLDSLRNRVLAWMRQDVWNQSLAFLPMLWAAFSLCVTPFARRSFYWLYPVTILSVLPFSLVEQRYFMAPVMFFMLFAEWKNVRVDYLTLTMYALATTYVYIGIASMEFWL